MTRPTPVLPDGFVNPAREFSLMPFWFLNDRLDAAELRRQLDDFQAHGVHGVVIHPRVGLPRDLGWMSDSLLAYYDLIIQEARERGMHVILYDEGMYPSGSASGHVVRENPSYAVQALELIDLAARPEWAPAASQALIRKLTHPVTGKPYAVVQRPSGSRIRGLHFVEPGEEHLPDAGPGRGSEPKEDEPLAADILNPDAVDCFIRLVYQRFADRYRSDIGKTILGIFTDEPSPLARYAPAGLKPGSAPVLARLSQILGYDFTPHLLALWLDDVPDASKLRAEYQRAISLLVEKTYYQRLFDWCEKNQIPLTGHPPHSDDIGPLRCFHMPGQDLVWRYVVPGPTATEGEHATMGKCSSSAMIHLGRRRNSNELLGAYGHELTWDEMVWLTNWCLIRGVNLLYPHAFYYSVRGPRRDERPPDVGPNSPWWDRYKPYALAASRCCWLNTDAEHVCHVAVLGEPNLLPWRAAQALQQNQIDFNYLEIRHLTEDARVDEQGVHLRGMHYRAVIIDGDIPDPSLLPQTLKPLTAKGRLIHFTPGTSALNGAVMAPSAQSLIERVRALTAEPIISAGPRSQELRVRTVRKSGRTWHMLFNEGTTPLRLEVTPTDPAAGAGVWLDPMQEHGMVIDRPVELSAGQLVVWSR